MARKVAVLTGTRANYGRLMPVMEAIKALDALQLLTIVTGMHLDESRGSTYREIEADGFVIDAKIPVPVNDGSGVAMARGIGTMVIELSRVVEELAPDLLLLLGDRGEELAGAIVGAHQNVPVVHMHGGEVTGSVDEPVRHAISKLSHVHFVASDDSARRLEAMGEDTWRIFNVGSPGLDYILRKERYSPDEVRVRLGLSPDLPFLVVLQHSVTTESEQASDQMRETLEAILAAGTETVVIYPNNDAGGDDMIQVIEEYSRHPGIRCFRNLPYKLYLSLMHAASALVGNSSSGIMEAPSFGLPCVNIGSRQSGRLRAANIIDCPHDRHTILRAIERALHDEGFLAVCARRENPYGDGNTASRVAKLLEELEMGPHLLQKRQTY